MGEEETVRALVAKRAELLLQLERHESAVRALRADVANVDVTIRMFTQGMARTLLAALRSAGKACTAEELAALADTTPRRAGWILQYMRRSGLVESEDGRPLTWRTTY
jgi:CTP:molybdopterin cytidylyltransferase MocA